MRRLHQIGDGIDRCGRVASIHKRLRGGVYDLLAGFIDLESALLVGFPGRFRGGYGHPGVPRLQSGSSARGEVKLRPSSRRLLMALFADTSSDAMLGSTKFDPPRGCAATGSAERFRDTK